MLPVATGCQFRSEFVQHRSRYICIDISEFDAVSRGRLLIHRQLAELAGMLGSRHIFRENDANVPKVREGKYFEDITSGLPCAFAS